LRKLIHGEARRHVASEQHREGVVVESSGGFVDGDAMLRFPQQLFNTVASGLQVVAVPAWGRHRWSDAEPSVFMISDVFGLTVSGLAGASASDHLCFATKSLKTHESSTWWKSAFAASVLFAHF
jgi:hypothetical protein